jgi:hypothetical protein
MEARPRGRIKVEVWRNKTNRMPCAGKSLDRPRARLAEVHAEVGLRDSCKSRPNDAYK